ncbi:hypothetical protein AG4045_021274, partial [Apium graveolens]
MDTGKGLRSMLKDKVHNETYRAAIKQHQDDYIKDKVYAVEATEIAVQLYIAPVTLPDRYSEKIDFWHNVYGIDMSAMVPWAIQDAYEDPCVETITSENLLALPQVVKHVDCYTVCIQELKMFTSSFNFQSLAR